METKTIPITKLYLSNNNSHALPVSTPHLPMFVLLCNLYMRKTCLFPSLPCMGLLFIWIFIRIYCVVVSFGMLVNYLN